MAAPGPIRIEHARPTLEVGDLGPALAFFTETVGLALVTTMGEPPTFALVGEGAAGIALVAADAPAIPAGAACYLTMQGLDALVDRLAAAGVDLAMAPTVHPWGLRDLVVRVPGDGPLVAFGERVET